MKDKILKSVGNKKKSLSKNDFAAKLDAGYSTVSAAVNELVADGKLVVVGKKKAEGAGRPAYLYNVPA